MRQVKLERIENMKSTLRENYRYVFAKYCGKQAGAGELRAIVERCLLGSLGSIGMFECGAKIISAEGENIVVRCARGSEGRLCAALALCNNLKGERVRLKVTAISGTIKALCKKEGVKKPARKKRT